MNSQKMNPLFLTCLAFVIFSMVGCSEDEIESGQLIVNGNLEKGSTSPDGWTSNTGNPDNFNFIWTED
ncbi:hypothetical protein [uncultured Marivirga sp.]|tara:strand:+ start:163585 stop:163788 length:204 start_codon:yes stop_codon:yes gene_type:complete